MIESYSLYTNIPELSDYETVANSSTTYQISFAVKAAHNAHILLRTNNNDKYFRIVIGGWFNAKSAIWDIDGNVLVEVNSAPLNHNEYVVFRLEWHDSDMVLNKATYNGGAISYSRLLTLTNWRSYYGQESLGKITSFGISTAMGSKNVVWKITDHQCEHLLPVPECRAVLVRQTIDRFHLANDSLAGNSEYGRAGVGNTFSLKYENWDFDTFIFATVDHQYFMAMTKEEIGGRLVTPNVFYQNQTRTFRYIDPDSDSWLQKSAKMHHRSSARVDPWLSINDHYNKPNNKVMYAEDGTYHNRIHLAAHGGLQVYILTFCVFSAFTVTAARWKI